MTWLETLAASVWRASWQAAVLAVLVMMLLRLFGNRMTPRCRYLLLALVVIRLLCVATPASPWSLFNVANWRQEPSVGSGSHSAEALPRGWLPAANSGREKTIPTPSERPRAVDPVQQARHSASAVAPPIEDARRPAPSASQVDRLVSYVGIAQVLAWIWIAGCVAVGMKVIIAVLLLRRRLGACRAVTDPAVLELLEFVRQEMRLRRTPGLLVTPAVSGPCTAGLWRPRILLPESLLTQPSTARLRHVFAHELAHVLRWDLWSNWLLIASRILHWFNPCAWWAVRQMQAEREAACDDIALAALGEADRPAYARTIVDLASRHGSCPLSPGLVGMFGPAERLSTRVERVLQSPAAPQLPPSIAASLLVCMGLLGLTDAMATPGSQQDARPAAAAAAEEAKERADGEYSISGVCVDRADGSPLAGVPIRLFAAQGLTAPAVEIARASTDADGQFAFEGLIPPRRRDRFTPLVYDVVADAAGRPFGFGFFWWRPVEDHQNVKVRVARHAATLTGKVVNDRGKPVPGATVMQASIDGRPFSGVLSAETDASGRFRIERMRGPDADKDRYKFGLQIVHKDYPRTTARFESLPEDGAVVTLTEGAIVTGSVIDEVTGLPAVGAIVRAQNVESSDRVTAVTDGTGRFRLAISEGRYSFVAEMKDRVCVATESRECLAGETLELEPLKLIEGGFIVGLVVNTKTGAPLTTADEGQPITIGLIGPSQPVAGAIRPTGLAEVNEQGRFVLRAAPGENFPYLVNIRGERMAWNTRKQRPVIVAAGETTEYSLLVTPEVPAAEKLAAARQVVDALSDEPSARVAQIVLEFRKLNHTVDETELWCMLMRELVAVGPQAVPQLCAELDETTENRTLRRLAFALRAIGDPRAVPALIRAIPRTLLPSSSDYGLIVEDEGLTAFMQSHDLDAGKRGSYFGFERPVREVFGALHELTGQDFDDQQLHSISLSGDPRRAALQRRLYGRQARRWEAWWRDHWQEFTNDPAYRDVNLSVVDEDLPPAADSLPRTARVGEGMIGAVISPVSESGKHVWHFLDLDTGYRPRWPTEVPRDEEQLDEAQLETWTKENGVDLACVTRAAADGAATYVLRGFGMQAWELTARELRNIDRLIVDGNLPTGRPVGELLMHFDAGADKYAPDAKAAFLFKTREGNYGLITTTDRVTRTANLTGLAGGPPKGVGFHKGVRFDLQPIIP